MFSKLLWYHRNFLKFPRLLQNPHELLVVLSRSILDLYETFEPFTKSVGLSQSAHVGAKKFSKFPWSSHDFPRANINFLRDFHWFFMNFPLRLLWNTWAFPEVLGSYLKYLRLVPWNRMNFHETFVISSGFLRFSGLLSRPRYFHKVPETSTKSSELGWSSWNNNRVLGPRISKDFSEVFWEFSGLSRSLYQTLQDFFQPHNFGGFRGRGQNLHGAINTYVDTF